MDNPTNEPIIIVINGVSIISIFVFLEKICPISTPIKAAIKAPKGSPGPESVIVPVWLMISLDNIGVANPGFFQGFLFNFFSFSEV